MFADAAGTLRDLAGPGFNPHQQVHLRPEDRLRVSATNRAEAKVLGTTVSANAVEAEVEADGAALVVIAQSFSLEVPAGRTGCGWPAGIASFSSAASSRW